MFWLTKRVDYAIFHRNPAGLGSRTIRSRWLVLAGLFAGLLTAPAIAESTAIAADRDDVTDQVELVNLLASPQATVHTLITSVNENNKATAVQCLDLSDFNSVIAANKGQHLAPLLKEIIDRMQRVRYGDISADPKTQSPYPLGKNHLAIDLDGRDASDAALINLERGDDDLWRFSRSTVAIIDDLWDRWEDRAEVEGLSVSLARESFEQWLRKRFPPHMRQRVFLLPTYKWIYLLCLIFVGFLADLALRLLLTYSISAWLRYRKEDEARKFERKLWKPIGLLAQALVWYGGTSLIDLPDLTMTVLLAGLKIFSVIAGVWTGFLLINLLAAYLAHKAIHTDSKFDDLLVPLISKSLKVFVVFVGVLTCAQAFSLPMAGLLGGTAIGGMALALASQDAVSNLFGSITVLIDRPFEIGDWIVTNSVEGTVESVGFRSTRIRTFYNSQITMPNSNLTTAIVDNMGRRRYRRIKTVLGVQYDTTPAQIEALCEGIRELLRRHPYTRKDYYHVYFNEYGDNSLNILLYCFLDCPDWSVELREKHRLFVDILMLAEQLRISFAFPTRTVHLYQETHSTQEPLADIHKASRAGQRIAADLTGQPFPSRQRVGPVEFRGPTDFSDDDANA